MGQHRVGGETHDTMNNRHNPGTANTQALESKAVLASTTDGKSAVRLLSVADVACYLGLSAWTIRQMIHTGQLPHIRVGRRILLDRRDVDKWIEQKKDLTVC